MTCGQYNCTRRAGWKLHLKIYPTRHDLRHHHLYSAAVGRVAYREQVVGTAAVGAGHEDNPVEGQHDRTSDSFLYFVEEGRCYTVQ